jgi:hypothetical protein
MNQITLLTGSSRFCVMRILRWEKNLLAHSLFPLRSNCSSLHINQFEFKHSNGQFTLPFHTTHLVITFNMWLRQYTTRWNVVGSIPDDIIGSFFFSIYLILPVALCRWGRVSFLTELSTRNLPEGKRRPITSPQAVSPENVGSLTSRNPIDLHGQLQVFLIEIPVYFASCSNKFSRMLWRVLQCLGERHSVQPLRR